MPARPPSKISYFFMRIKKEYIRQVVSPARTVVPSLPLEYQIEPINYCNLRCPTCSSLRLGGTDKKWMTTKTFIKIADQLPSYSVVYLTNWGEPMLNPEIISIIKEGKKRGLMMRLDSNFNYDPKLNWEIVTSGLDSIKASIDGTSQETYEKFRRGGSFDLAWRNFTEIARLKHELKSRTPELIWQFIVNRYNEHEVKNAKEMIVRVGGNAKLVFIPMGLRQDKTDWDQYSGEEMERMKREWLPSKKKYILPFFRNRKPNAAVSRTSCPWLWRSMSISVNLDVTPCCHAYMSKHAFGSLNDSSLSQIWNNQAYRTSRNMFLDTSYQGCRTICSRCRNFIRGRTPNVIIRHWRFLLWFLRRSVFKLVELARSG